MVGTGGDTATTHTGQMTVRAPWGRRAALFGAALRSDYPLAGRESQSFKLAIAIYLVGFRLEEELWTSCSEH